MFYVLNCLFRSGNLLNLVTSLAGHLYSRMAWLTLLSKSFCRVLSLAATSQSPKVTHFLSFLLPGLYNLIVPFPERSNPLELLTPIAFGTLGLVLLIQSFKKTELFIVHIESLLHLLLFLALTIEPSIFLRPAPHFVNIPAVLLSGSAGPCLNHVGRRL